MRLIIATLALSAWGPILDGNAQENPPQQVDLLTFANGATVVSVNADQPGVAISDEQGLWAIDGSNTKYLLTPKPGTADVTVEIVIQLPAPTVLEEFAVPSIHETPSPSQTFVRDIKIFGSAAGPESDYTLLGEKVLSVHTRKGEFTRFESVSNAQVRWVKIQLSGGLDIALEKTFFDFSELIGYGEQDPVPLSEEFSGEWKGRGVLVGLSQTGAIVSGCYDKRGDLTGTVTGNILRATGVGRDDGVQSLFILNIDKDGNIDGYRSTNGAPFRRYTGIPTDTDVGCRQPEKPVLSCGSIIHGINFDFDSAVMRDDSAPIISELFSGLQQDPSSEIVIEGHTSSEGSEAYNEDLSERRALAVVEALVALGIESNRIAAAGIGESRPISDNATESGRSLNRRVEVACKN